MSGWKIGSVTVAPVIELHWPIPATFLLPEATPERLELSGEWLRPSFLGEEGVIPLVIQAFLVESRGRKVIIDTCIGNGKTRPLEAFDQLDTPFLERLRDAGFPPEKVDTVVCTHLHVDHVGWNTKKVDGEWIPSFPNARYLVTRADFEHWSRESEEMAAAVFADSVAPVFDAGLVDLVESDHEITPELRLLPTPGHTPGHASVAISSDGEEAVITGDLMHHPSQCRHPEWECRADVDPKLAKQTRLDFLHRFGGGRVLVIGTHFAAPTALHVVRAGERWKVESPET